MPWPDSSRLLPEPEDVLIEVPDGGRGLSATIKGGRSLDRLMPVEEPDHAISPRVLVEKRLGGKVSEQTSRCWCATSRTNIRGA